MLLTRDSSSSPPLKSREWEDTCEVEVDTLLDEATVVDGSVVLTGVLPRALFLSRSIINRRCPRSLELKLLLTLVEEATVPLLRTLVTEHESLSR